MSNPPYNIYKDREKTIEVYDGESRDRVIKFNDVYMDYWLTGDALPLPPIYEYDEGVWWWSSGWDRLYKLDSTGSVKSDYQVGSQVETQDCILISSDYIMFGNPCWIYDTDGVGNDAVIPIHLLYGYYADFQSGYKRSAIGLKCLENTDFTKLTKTYSGITNPSSTHKAYYFANATRGDCDDAGTEFTTGAYTAVTTSDDSDTVITAVSGQYSKARFEVYIPDSLTNAKVIRITTECQQPDVRLYVLYPGTSTYYEVNTHSSTDADEFVIGNLGVSASSFVSSNYLKFCLEGNVVNTALNVDYVGVEIVSTTEDPTDNMDTFPWEGTFFYESQYNDDSFRQAVSELGEEITFYKTGESDVAVRGRLRLRLEITSPGYQFFYYPANEINLTGYAFVKDGLTFTVTKTETVTIAKHDIYKKAYMSYA